MIKPSDNTTDNENDIDPERSHGRDLDRRWIVAGLTEITRNPGRALTAMVGPPGARRKHVRQQLRVTPIEHAAAKLVAHTLAIHVGRPVALSLVMRLAMNRLVDECTRSFADAAVAARLKADLIAAREERAAE